MINANNKIDVRESFWRLTDITKIGEKYKIDQNLKSLKIHTA